MERGSVVQLGRTVLLEGEGVLLIATEAVGAANDPGFFALHGIALQPPLLLVVKAKNHFRAAFEPLCEAIFDADLPGPAAADLATLPFTRARWEDAP
jgi:microcystin degradation protein MlrC